MLGRKQWPERWPERDAQRSGQKFMASEWMIRKGWPERKDQHGFDKKDGQKGIARKECQKDSPDIDEQKRPELIGRKGWPRDGQKGMSRKACPDGGQKGEAAMIARGESERRTKV